MTPPHPVWSLSSDDWVSAGDLYPGESIATIDGSAMVVGTVPASERTVYNLEVLGHHTYFVGDDGVWVHNTYPGRFPANPDNLLPGLPRSPRGHIHPNSRTRIRPERHDLKPGETYNPRHHGQHYHVEIRLDVNKSWNNPGNVIKIKPHGYKLGSGTGFLPGEKFPGLP